jgi:hypothetical protein
MTHSLSRKGREGNHKIGLGGTYIGRLWRFGAEGKRAERRFDKELTQD